MTNRTPQILASVLLLLMLYVGSYLALVVPESENYWNWTRLRTSPVVRLPLYRFGGELSERVFWPLEQIDRMVRSHAWHPDRTYQPTTIELGEWAG